jgi:hypothetical protein
MQQSSLRACRLCPFLPKVASYAERTSHISSFLDVQYVAFVMVVNAICTQADRFHARCQNWMCSKLNQALQAVRRNNEATMSVRFDNKEDVAMLDEGLQTTRERRVVALALSPLVRGELFEIVLHISDTDAPLLGEVVLGHLLDIYCVKQEVKGYHQMSNVWRNKDQETDIG